MYLTLTDEKFQTVALVDVYESALWVDRYNEAGDFEIYTSAHHPIMQFMKEDYYLFKRDSEHAMIIEEIEIRSDAEDGDKAIITGRSLESILDRRIIWTMTNFASNTTVQNGIKKLLEDSIINPTNEKRRISNFIFKESTDTRITSMTFEAQYTGDNLYDVICEICKAFNLGFKITLDENYNFVFELYIGEDRTYDQFANPFIIFSPNFENIINSDYLESKRTLKNITLIAGEGEGAERRTATTISNTADATIEPESLYRRELFTDARDIASTDEEGQAIPDEDYIKKLKQRGLEKLSQNTMTQTFNGQVESTKLFVYGRDFYMGDLVQIKNEFGIEGTARIVEFITSEDIHGTETYPTFEAVQ